MSVAILLLVGCKPQPPKSYQDMQREFDAKEIQAHPVGRYQFIEKETYVDGTIEYACLDTATGKISYASIYQDPKKTSTFSCAK